MGNPDEIVDIVDAQDNVLHQATKSEAHTKGLLHRTSICEVIDSDGRWTLIKQGKHKQDPGVYLSPVGGHVAAGESAEEALIREMEEEGGLVNTRFKYIGKAIYDREVPHLKRRENHYFILFEAYSDNELVLNDESLSQHKFTPKDLREEIQLYPEKFGAPFKFLLNLFYPHIYHEQTKGTR